MKLEKHEGVGTQSHYTDCGIEPIDYIIANGDGIPFCRANVIKYVSRYDKKNGIEDLKKAKQYLDWLIALEEKECNQK